jgi:hypothetical protein
LIVVAVPSVASFFVPFLTPLATLLTAAYHFFAADVTLPRWGFWLWLCVSIGGAVLASVRIYAANAPSFRWVQPFQQYQTDELFGFRWRFYTTASGEVHSLKMFCPACDYQMSESDFDPSFNGGYNCACEACGHTQHVQMGDYHDLEGKAEKEAERRVRTGDWKQAKSPKIAK